MEKLIKDILNRRGSLHRINDKNFYSEESVIACIKESLNANKQQLIEDLSTIESCYPIEFDDIDRTANYIIASRSRL